MFIVARNTLIAVFFSSTIVLKLLKTAEGIRKLLDTVAEALPQVSDLKRLNFNMKLLRCLRFVIF